MQKRNSLVKICIFLGMVFIPIGVSYAYHDDREDINSNNFQTGTLEVELDEETEDAKGSLVSPSESVEKYYRVENEGTEEFDYGLVSDDFGGDVGFCSEIRVKVYHLDSSTPDDSKYDGYLKDLDLNVDSSYAEMYLESSQESDFKLEYYLSDTADSANSLSSCVFKIVAKAWMPDYEYGKAYYDSASESQELVAGDWEIEMGYESVETLDDDTDGDPPLGFCGITTEESEDDAAHLKIKWEKVEGTEKYVLHMFVQDTEWSSVDTTEVLLTDPKLSEVSGIMTYETTVSEEGLYGYYIQAFNSEGDMVGATTPNEEDFTCTFEVDWVEEEEEEESEPLELMIVNPLVLGMTDDQDDNENDDTSNPELPGDVLDEVLETETLPETTYEEPAGASE